MKATFSKGVNGPPASTRKTRERLLLQTHLAFLVLQLYSILKLISSLLIQILLLGLIDNIFFPE